MKLDAVLWDYDGTLVNSVPKNIDITKTILSIVAPHLTGEHLPKYLHSEALYHEVNHAAKNWQELYVKYYGMSDEEMVIAGSMWAEHQEKNQTQVSLFNGITKIIDRFSDIRHGICSQNSQKNIRNVLEIHGINGPFKAVVGYDDVSNGNQKPHPDGGMKCLESIFGHTNSQLLMYIGDHEADTQFARNLQSVLGGQAKVISVAAAYSQSDPSGWAVQPDHIATNVEDLTSIIGKYL
ncbi:HAD family hydrolase [Shewanella psychropiezotolerans]|uniref:phosphoglycolate phosphatase n=1 Tax=Shewanella psychropiezotolerans TaxID=2593655 RepID=A0ABX5X4P8_9GAMM|nr:HAD family hydrolase [Shewanella psychropiezotolerans]QDO86320.1 HAD family hydrolase [Shewanella psychropiezotolerans]